MDIKQLSNIATGFGNLLKSKLIVLDDEKEKLGKKRISVCNSCEFKSKANTCKKCGCFLPAKVLSVNDKCPIKLW